MPRTTSKQDRMGTTETSTAGPQSKPRNRIKELTTGSKARGRATCQTGKPASAKAKQAKKDAR